jgi:flagellar motor switch/type III secretory pathway protein FliN
VEPLVERMRGVAESTEAGSGAAVDELGRGVAGAPVLLRAEVGSVQMPIERMLAIAPGTVVELGRRAEDGVRLIAEEVSIARGKPGCSGTRRAVKLLDADEAPARCEIYARLGRGELERARAHVEGDDNAHAADAPILRNIFVRVWAELGRTHMALGETLELAQGSVVELDQASESPVELFANGLCFANGSLVVTPGGAWGIEVRALV